MSTTEPIAGLLSNPLSRQMTSRAPSTREFRARLPMPAADWPDDSRHGQSATALSESRLLKQVLDEVDYGAILLSRDDVVLHLNHAARTALGSDQHPLQLGDGRLGARQAIDGQRLADGLARARRGQRRLLFLGEATRSVGVSIVPLDADAVDGPTATMLLLGKHPAAGDLGLQCFARSHRLTTTETWVLESICHGLEAREVATQRRIGLTTVRSHIASIREKTGCRSMRQLLHCVAALPPLMGLLRMAG